MMAGLLDGFDLNSPAAQGLLAAAFGGLAGARRGQPLNSIGRAGLAGLSGYGGAQDRATALAEGAVKRNYMQSQIDENLSQTAQRKAALQRQQQQDEYFMGKPGEGLLADAPTSPGAYAPSVDGMGPVAPLPAFGAAPTLGKFDEWSTQFGIPKDALIADYRSNGGKGIADMLYKRGVPDMQVTGGYAFDKNTQRPGYLPSLSTSQDGKTSMVQIGPDGMPVVSAPRGALDTFEGYQRAQASFKPIKYFNPATQREEFASEADVVKPTPTTTATTPLLSLPAPQAGVTGAFQGDPARVAASIASIRDPQERSNAQAAFDSQMRSSGGSLPSARLAAGPSAAEAAAAKASEARAVDTAKADVVRDTSEKKQTKSANDMLLDVRRAKVLLNQGPTASTVGEWADKGANFLGYTNPGAKTAARLDVVAGSLVNNVPRMEGPQSNLDVENYKTMAGRVADRTLPIEQRLAAADEVERLQLKYASQNGGVSDPDSAKPKPSGEVVATLPPANLGNKGQRARNMATGQIMVSDGIQWKPE